MLVLLPFLLQKLWFGTTSTTSVLFLACVSCLLNTVGCFLEGLVHNDDDYASFSAGFLSVITSFPDIGDAAKDVILESRKTRSSRGEELQMLLVGVSYCFTGIVCGCLAYGLGVWWRRKSSLLQPAGSDHQRKDVDAVLSGSILVATLAVFVLVGENEQNVQAQNRFSENAEDAVLGHGEGRLDGGAGSGRRRAFAGGSSGPSPIIDLNRPQLHCPAGPAFGLLLACALSALGSCLGTYIVESVSSSCRRRGVKEKEDHHDAAGTEAEEEVEDHDLEALGTNPAGRRRRGIAAPSLALGSRFLPKYDFFRSTRLLSRTDAEICGRAVNNFLACALCLAIRVLYPQTPFVLYKISTSFCGAVSSMSGTIGDICTSSWSSTRTSSQNKHKGNYRANGNEKQTGGRRGAKMMGCNLAFHLGMLIAFMVLMLHLANLGEPFLLEMRHERLTNNTVFVSGSFGRAEDLEEGVAGTGTEADVEI